MHTHLRRRAGRYQFRARVPSDLVQRLKRTELAISVATADPAVARRRGAALMLACMDLFDAIRSDPMITQEQIDATVRTLIARYRIETVNMSAMTRLSPTAAEQAANMQARRNVLARMLQLDLEGRTSGAAMIGLAIDSAEAAGLAISTDTPGLDTLARRTALVYLDEQRRDQTGAEPSLASDPAPAPPSVPAAPSSTVPAGLHPNAAMSLSQLLPEFLARRGLAPKTEDDFWRVIRAFDDWAGEPSVYAITRVMLVDYKRFLETVPTHITQRFPGLSIKGAIAANIRRARPFDTLDAKTINSKHLAFLRSIMGWAVNNSYAADNPTKGVKSEVGKTKAARDKRKPFDTENLNAIFGHPTFARSAPTAKFWVPLIALFTGCRPAEIAQLTPADVREIEGVLCFVVSDADGKRVKTAAGVRRVPVHPELVRLGLRQFVAQRRSERAERLFPEWLPGRNGDWSHGTSRWFNRTLLPAVGIKDDELVFYSFRHAFRDAMRRAKIDSEIGHALFGHADTSVHGHYGEGSSAIAVKDLASAMRNIEYNGLDLKRLYLK